MDTFSPRPVFVYGTLRPGFGNYRRILEGRTTSEVAAVLDGVVMHGVDRPFPFLIEGPGRAVGDLVYLDAYEDTLARLDQLEGYRGDDAGRNLYRRVVRSVTPKHGPAVDAWVYLAGPSLLDWISADTVVPDGDWARGGELRR